MCAPGSAAPTGSQTPAAESDLDYVKGNGVLKIGYTLFCYNHVNIVFC